MSAPLCGENLVRIAFLDEAGRSRQEPIIVVAGIIIHGDRTYRDLEAQLREIGKLLPEGDRKGFVFHAKDIFHGAGRYFKDREKWPREQRWPILRAIAALPRQFGLPVVFAHLEKAEYHDYAAPQLTKHSNERNRSEITDIAEHMAVFARAEIAIERQMHRFPRDEICMLVAEDTDRVKQAIKISHATLRDPEEIANSGYLTEIEGLPITKIVDTPHFAAKAESAPLQVADTCAFLILRRLMRRIESQEFFEQIAPQLTWTASDFGDSMGAEQIGMGSRY
jgi:hypothetical protein